MYHTPQKAVTIKKKSGKLQDFDYEKILVAVGKSATRVCYDLSDSEKESIVNCIVDRINISGKDVITVEVMHNYVETSLDQINPALAKSYRDYRNWKQDFAKMMDKINTRANDIMYRGDKENSNSDSSLVSTKRCLIFNEFNKELYRKFFMTAEELQAEKDGYIHIHDMSARRDTMNCCLFDVKNVLTGGFEMGNIWYNEPKSLDVAFDVIGDIVLSAASQQYGGFTVPNVELILEPYAEKSYEAYKADYIRLGLTEEAAHKESIDKIKRDFEQGFQGWEYKFNTVASSRGDYPFITLTAGTGTGRFAKMATTTMFEVRSKGQGKKGFKKPVLFPKLVFLYDKNLHGEGKPLEDVFEAGVNCSCKTMYPDWLSLTGKGYISDMYKQYGSIISPMGCRAFLSPWWEKGGLKKADEFDKPVFVGRFNIGVVSLNLPLILAKAREEYQVNNSHLE